MERILELDSRDGVRIVVVDNDPEESGRATAVAGPRAVPIEYVVEAKPGIAAARNRALDACADSRLLAFIDDDEVPAQGWLTALLAAWRTFQADAVMGRVISLLPDEVDPWIPAGGFFERPVHATGTRLDAAATFNVLVDLDTVRRFALRFDESLGLSGGEDTIFFRQLVRAGGTIVACEESVATDPLDGERATRRWVHRRAISQGSVLQTTRLRLASSRSARFLTRAQGIAGGFARIGAGCGLVMVGVATWSLARRARGSRMVLRGCGVLIASLGLRYRTYRRTDRVRQRASRDRCG